MKTLVCWHAERAGIDVVSHAVTTLRNRRIPLDRVLYLVQKGKGARPPASIDGVPLDLVEIALEDPTRHAEIDAAIRSRVCPLLRGEVHINVSPGTPAMHAVWLVLHAGGAFPPNTRLWSSQYNPETKRTRIDPVEFRVSTYLAEIRERGRIEPDVASYDAEARSPARREALERLMVYSRVPGAPLLVLGERGTGKTRLVETFVGPLKQRANVVTLACGGLDSSLAESLLFGHRRGAFTGAAADRRGLLLEANGGILFLDEVQDLPQAAQRKLVRVLGDRHHRFRPLGADGEQSVDVEVLCASNLPLDALRSRLDADLFDRLSHLLVTIPPLRECREDLAEDWQHVWRELRASDALPEAAPWSENLATLLAVHPLPGNLRDLQRLALLTSAWCSAIEPAAALAKAITEWNHAVATPPDNPMGQGSRRDRIRWFQRRLAQWAKGKHGTWAAAAKALECDEKTLRADGGDRPSEPL